MDKLSLLESSVKLSGMGLEIGPSYNPIAPKAKGYNVKVLDWLDKAQLIERYRNHNVDVSLIEEVDYLWAGEPFRDLVGAQKFDWIVASHVIEHTPDFIDFIQNCESVLADNGVLFLAVPDKRFCFDCFRGITTLSHVIDRNEAVVKKHTRGSVAEYYMNVVSRGGRISWEEGFKDNFEFVHSFSETLDCVASVESGEFIDIHSWCFIPSSFRLLIQDLRDLSYIQLKEVLFVDTQGCEFVVVLSRSGAGSGSSRRELVQRINAELAVSY